MKEKIGTEFINGVPEEYAEELKKGITEGNVDIRGIEIRG